jgi:beta-lactamase class D
MAPAIADMPSWPRPLADYAAGKAACIVVYSADADQFVIHNPEQCRERLSPCSTFKIPNALIGLESGVLTGPGDTRKWDGTQHSRKVLNQDHDLSSAIKFSIVWYFQSVALDIGEARMQAALDAFDYGNRDISGGQDRFWLSSSLKISALEQSTFMKALDEESLPAGKENQQTVKAMMLQDYSLPEGFTGELYGKTGSCPGNDDTTGHGWFTGFYHRGENQYVFAVNVKGEEQWGWQAREILIEVLQEMR